MSHMIKIINTVKPKLLERAFKEIGFDKLERIIKGTLEREAHKLTGKELEEIKSLQRLALRLWKQAVVIKAGKQCEAIDVKGKRCNKIKYLQAHHIESYTTNRGLRVDPKNGVCFCPTHHKFGWLSGHKSFCFMYNFMILVRSSDLVYLLRHYQERVEITKAFLMHQISILQQEIEK